MIELLRLLSKGNDWTIFSLAYISACGPLVSSLSSRNRCTDAVHSLAQFFGSPTYRIADGKLSLLGALGPEFEAMIREHHGMINQSGASGGLDYGSISQSGEGVVLTAAPEAPAGSFHSTPLAPALRERLRIILRPFFLKYDQDRTSTIDGAELGL